MSGYQEYEVGAGWIDPVSLGKRLGGGVRALCCGRDSATGGWLGALALSLCVLSWWNNMTVTEVVAWIAGRIRDLLA